MEENMNFFKKREEDELDNDVGVEVEEKPSGNGHTNKKPVAGDDVDYANITTRRRRPGNWPGPQNPSSRDSEINRPLNQFEQVDLEDQKMGVGYTYLEKCLSIFIEKIPNISAAMAEAIDGLGKEMSKNLKDLRTTLYSEFTFWAGLICSSFDTAIGFITIISWFTTIDLMWWITGGALGIFISVLLVEHYMTSELLDPNHAPPKFKSILKDNPSESDISKFLERKNSFLHNLDFVIGLIGIVFGLFSYIYKNVTDKTAGVLIGISVGGIILLINYAFKKTVEKRSRIMFIDVNYKVIKVWKLELLFDKFNMTILTTAKYFDNLNKSIASNIKPKEKW